MSQSNIEKKKSDIQKYVCDVCNLCTNTSEFMCVCVCVYIYMREREREGGREGRRGRREMEL